MNGMNRRKANGTNPLAVYAMATAADIEEGDIVCLDAEGKAIEASDTAGLQVAGIAVHVDKAANTVEVRDGIVGLDIADSNGPERGDRGKPVYATGPTEVATTSSNAVCVGILVDVYDDEAFVDIRPGYAAAAAAGAAAGATAGATAGADAIAADLEDPESTIKAAALVEGAAAIAADLEDAESTIKAAALAEGAAAIAADLEDAESTIKAANLNAAGNVRLVEAPAAANSPGVKGDIASDGTSFFLCTATDEWVKVALTLAAW